MEEQKPEMAEAPAVPVARENAGDTVRASWPVSLHLLRTNLSHCSPEGREAVIAAFMWCIDEKHPMRREEFARRVGYSENVIYKIVTGKYEHPTTKERMDVPDKLVKGIRDFLELERARWVGMQTTFVETPTAKRIWTMCDLARESQTPVFILGPSHIGKTWALEYYTGANNHGRTNYVRMKAASGLGGMVRRLAEKVGVSPESNTAQLVDRIKRALTPNMLVIIDEVHLLAYTYRRESFFSCLEVIREIYDESQCGMVLCATRLLLERMGQGTHGEMEQLLRRGVHKVHLPMQPTKGDVEAILAHYGMELPEKDEEIVVGRVSEKPYEVVRQVCERDGLKALTERLRYACKLAHKTQVKVSWKQFIDAHLRIVKEGAKLNPEAYL